MWRGEKSRTHKTQEEKHRIERERERDRARELHAIRITSKFHSLVMSYFFFAELMAARFMHVLGLSTKRCLRVKGEKQQNPTSIQHNFWNSMLPCCETRCPGPMQIIRSHENKCLL